MFIDDGVRVCVGPWRGFKFSVSYKASKLSFRAFSSRRSSLTQTFVESCVEFEVAHLFHTHGSEIAIPRDSYLNWLTCTCTV